MSAIISPRQAASMKAWLKRLYLAWIHYLDPLWVPLENALLHLYVRVFPRHFWRRLNRAIDAGMGYFERIPDWEIDSLYALRHFVDATFDARLAMSDAALARYRQLWKDPFLRLFDRDYQPERDGASCPNTYVPPRKMHTLMMHCVEADRLDLKSDFLHELCAMDDNGDYGTTHILLGCVFLKTFSHIDPALLDQTIQSTIPAITQAQRRGRIGDIYSERVAMLQWLGLHDLIDPAWIVRIIHGQMRDGGWYWTRPPFRTDSYQHPTCLALAALLQFRRQHQGNSKACAR